MGREPNGILRPGPEAEVLRTAAVFPGEHSSDLPDLLVRWHRDTPIAGVASDRIGCIVRPDTSTRRSGDHRPEGMFFVRGPGVAPGEIRAGVRAEDFAPTIAALLGVTLEDVDGRPQLDRFASSSAHRA